MINEFERSENRLAERKAIMPLGNSCEALPSFPSREGLGVCDERRGEPVCSPVRQEDSIFFGQK